ncbi:MAG: DUF5656 family protein [Thermomicrobiales bacterium]
METETGTRPGVDPGRAAGSEERAVQPAPWAGGAANGPSGAVPGASMQEIRQPTFGQGIVVSVGVALALLVLAISAIRDAENTGLPLTETTRPLYWGLAILTVLSAGIGAQFAERTAARAAAAVGHPRDTGRMETAWAVPVVATIAAVMMVATYHNTTMLVGGPAIAFFGIAGALLSRDLLDDATESTQRTAMAIHTFVIDGIAFLALSAVYLNKMSSWVSAPLVGILSGILILETLERGSIDKTTRGVFAIAGGFIMAQCTIILNWWPTHGWTGGAVLLVCFYLIAGVLLERTRRTHMRSRDVIEFGVVSLTALIVLAFTA